VPRVIHRPCCCSAEAAEDPQSNALGVESRDGHPNCGFVLHLTLGWLRLSATPGWGPFPLGGTEAPGGPSG